MREGAPRWTLSRPKSCGIFFLVVMPATPAATVCQSIAIARAVGGAGNDNLTPAPAFPVPPPPHLFPPTVPPTWANANGLLGASAVSPNPDYRNSFAHRVLLGGGVSSSSLPCVTLPPVLLRFAGLALLRCDEPKILILQRKLAPSGERWCLVAAMRLFPTSEAFLRVVKVSK